jgi:hypothetical protein
MNLMRMLADYVKRDWNSHPTRVIAELYGWAISTGSSIVFALTVPHPPFLMLYPLWLSGLFALTFCAFSRGSVGMVALNISMIIIDMIGYGRLIAQRFFS